MSLTTTAFIACSVDGFIARADGALDWLELANTPDEDYGYAAFMATVDVLIMGRHTYQKVLSFPEWPYAGVRVIVLSRQQQAIPAALQAKVEWDGGDLASLLRRLQAEAVQQVYVDGGQTIQRFIAEGRLNRLILNRLPVLLGQGIPLFGGMPQDVVLQHQTTQVFHSGLVQSQYQVISSTKN